MIIFRKSGYRFNTKAIFLISIFFIAFLYACTVTETHKTMETPSVEGSYFVYSGTRYPLVVGKFANRSNYMNGIFSDGNDRLGSQAKMILKTHLVQTNRFILMERENLEEMAIESKLTGNAQALEGANQVITGEVTEFGRKETGDKALFGIFGQGKQQTAYSKISLNIVDVRTSRTIYSVQGAGEYTLNNREILGFGSTAEYDSTLNGKVINLAIIDVVNKLVSDLDKGKWPQF